MNSGDFAIVLSGDFAGRDACWSARGRALELAAPFRALFSLGWGLNSTYFAVMSVLVVATHCQVPVTLIQVSTNRSL